MKNKIKEIALQAGGSHYPDVGGETLQKFADLLLAEVFDAINTSNLQHLAYTTYDLGVVNSIREMTINAINERFKE